MNETLETPELRLREQRADKWGEPYVQEWYCDVPDGEFTVIRQEWSEDYAVRKIFEVRV